MDESSRPRTRAPLTLEAERIGRVTEGLLLGVSDQVDIIEPVEKFTANLQSKPGVRNIFNVGLEEWCPAGGIQYDLIWIQWCSN